MHSLTEGACAGPACASFCSAAQAFSVLTLYVYSMEAHLGADLEARRKHFCSVHRSLASAHRVLQPRRRPDQNGLIPNAAHALVTTPAFASAYSQALGYPKNLDEYIVKARVRLLLTGTRASCPARRRG